MAPLIRGAARFAALRGILSRKRAQKLSSLPAELPMVLDQRTLGLPVIDSTRALARYAAGHVLDAELSSADALPEKVKMPMLQRTEFF